MRRRRRRPRPGIISRLVYASVMSLSQPCLKKARGAMEGVAFNLASPHAQYCTEAVLGDHGPADRRHRTAAHRRDVHLWCSHLSLLGCIESVRTHSQDLRPRIGCGRSNLARCRHRSSLLAASRPFNILLPGRFHSIRHGAGRVLLSAHAIVLARSGLWPTLVLLGSSLCVDISPMAQGPRADRFRANQPTG